MLENSAAMAIYGHESFADWEELDEDRLAARDYAWMLSLNVVRGTEGVWRSFRDGYAAGGQVGRRRYARSQARPGLC